MPTCELRVARRPCGPWSPSNGTAASIWKMAFQSPPIATFPRKPRFDVPEVRRPRASWFTPVYPVALLGTWFGPLVTGRVVAPVVFGTSRNGRRVPYTSTFTVSAFAPEAQSAQASAAILPFFMSPSLGPGTDFEPAAPCGGSGNPD